MTSRELHRKLAAALRIVDFVERMLDYDDPVGRLDDEEMTKLMIADFRDLYPEGGHR